MNEVKIEVRRGKEKKEIAMDIDRGFLRSKTIVIMTVDQALRLAEGLLVVAGEVATSVAKTG